MRSLAIIALLSSMDALAVRADDSVEPGYTLLFNGKNLDGWQTRTAKKESLDRKTEAFGGRFTAKDGELVIDPAVKGDVIIETRKSFGGKVTFVSSSSRTQSATTISSSSAPSSTSKRKTSRL
jgi:hypothetical protein